MLEEIARVIVEESKAQRYKLPASTQRFLILGVNEYRSLDYDVCNQWDYNYPCNPVIYSDLPIIVTRQANLQVGYSAGEGLEKLVPEKISIKALQEENSELKLQMKILLTELDHLREFVEESEFFT